MPREIPRLLDPIDRVAEILFGLIMAVTIIGALSVADAGRAEIRSVLAAAIACNIAWGLVDAVMYVVRAMTDGARRANRGEGGGSPILTARMLDKAFAVFVMVVLVNRAPEVVTSRTTWPLKSLPASDWHTSAVG